MKFNVYKSDILVDKTVLTLFLLRAFLQKYTNISKLCKQLEAGLDTDFFQCSFLYKIFLLYFLSSATHDEDILTQTSEPLKSSNLSIFYCSMIPAIHVRLLSLPA